MGKAHVNCGRDRGTDQLQPKTNEPLSSTSMPPTGCSAPKHAAREQPRQQLVLVRFDVQLEEAETIVALFRQLVQHKCCEVNRGNVDET